MTISIPGLVDQLGSLVDRENVIEVNPSEMNVQLLAETAQTVIKTK
ncbi:MAG TPA: hypothetical protein PK957_04080 [Candidatus Dojkabacteria bacterium]|nr:hypothetical protein [Candidatus Dojkabacteria bacterium]HQF36244.1 hypothetical protein [Candidatus Dojkabacteria bacterium]